MFKKKEKGFADDIKHSTVKLLMDRFQFLSFRSKLALVVGIILCAFTLVYSVVLTMVLPNLNIALTDKEKWITSVVIIRWIGIIIVGVGAVFTFLDIFKIILPEAFDNKLKTQKKLNKKKKTTKKLPKSKKETKKVEKKEVKKD